MEVSALTPGKRIATLDILRGLALLGMIAAHFHKFASVESVTGATTWLGGLITLFIAEKDRTIFAFLFGVSFGVMLRGIEARGQPVVAIFLRRMAVLFVIGFAVEALTPFEILRDYAWWGVALLFLRNQPTRTLLVLAVISAAAFSLRDAVDSGWSVARQGRTETVAAEHVADRRFEEEKREAQQPRAAYGEAVRARVAFMSRKIFSLSSLTPTIYLALFILGLLAVRHGIFEAPLAHAAVLRGAAFAGVVIWIVAWVVLARVPPDFCTPHIAERLREGFGVLDEQYLAFACIGGVTLLLAYRPAWQHWLAPCAWAGRMALTNYILQAVFIDLLSASYGLHRRLGPDGELVGIAGTFACLALLSRAWLARFRYGPVEWMWRSLTYWRREPLRLAAGKAGGLPATAAAD